MNNGVITTEDYGHSLEDLKVLRINWSLIEMF